MPEPSKGEIATQFILTAVGAAAAGPLGALLGSAVPASTPYFKSIIEQSSGVGAKFVSDRLKSFSSTPEVLPLAAAFQTALRSALKEISNAEFADWFANWEAHLSRPGALLQKSAEEVVQQFIQDDGVSKTQLLAGLASARITLLERMDFECRASTDGSLSIRRAFEPRSLPAFLQRYIEDRLPAALESALGAALAENQAAWVVVTLQFQSETRADHASLLAGQARLEEKLDKLLGVHSDLATFQAETPSSADDPEARQVQDLISEGRLDEAGTLLDELSENADRRAARWRFDRGKLFELRFQWTEALEQYARAYQIQPDSADFGFAYARVLQKQNRFSEAGPVYESVLEVFRHTSDRLPEVAKTLNNLAILYTDTQRLAEAERAYEDALHIRRVLAAGKPDAYLPDVAMTLNNLAILYSDTQRLAEAERAYTESLKIRRALAAGNPNAYLPNVATTLNNLANLYNGTQRLAEAERAYEEALQIRRTLAADNPNAYLPYVVTTLNNLAILYSDTQRFAQAELAYEETLQTYRALASGNPDAYLPYVATTLNNLANLYSDTQRLGQAERAYEEALQTYRALAASNSNAYLPDVAMTLNNLAILYRGTQRLSQAERAYEEALQTYRFLAADNSDAYLPYVATTLQNVAVLSCQMSRFDMAENCAREAAAIFDKFVKTAPEAFAPKAAKARETLAWVLRSRDSAG